MRISIAILACALTTVGCQATSVKPEAEITPETVSPLLMKVEAGEADNISKVEYTDLIAGNTIRGTNGSTTVYRSDGVKIIKEKDGKVTTRKWYRDEGGILCHTLWKDESLSCLAEVADFSAARSGSTLFTTSRGFFNEWELVEGNPENL